MQLSLSEHEFKSVQGYKDKIPECICLLKRQTLNTNRAVCVVQLPEIPSDINSYISSLRTRIAFKVGFFPLLWGLGVQVVILCPGITKENLSPKDYVAKVDNQWAIVQSVFFVDPQKGEFIEGRTWASFLRENSKILFQKNYRPIIPMSALNKAMLHRCYAAGLANARRKLRRYMINRGDQIVRKFQEN